MRRVPLFVLLPFECLALRFAVAVLFLPGIRFGFLGVLDQRAAGPAQYTTQPPLENKTDDEYCSKTDERLHQQRSALVAAEERPEPVR